MDEQKILKITDLVDEPAVIRCPHCNMSKGAKMPHEWIGRLL